MIKNKKLYWIVGFLILLTTKQSFADISILDNLLTISGNLRSYFFTKDTVNIPDQYSFSFGGGLNVETAPMFDYFQADAALYTAQPLGLNPQDKIHTFQSLPGTALTTLGQSYLQFQKNNFLLRGGNQVIETPWMSASDSRMIPAAYQGFYSTYSPSDDWTLTALRMFRFKSRVISGFLHNNLYNVNEEGNAVIPPLGDTPTNGALAFGGDYHNNGLSSKGWIYEFYNIAKLFYNENIWIINTSTRIKPILGAQLLRETNDGSDLIGEATSTSGANASALGALLGAQDENIKLMLAYNKTFFHSGAFGDGNIISPYSAGYATDPLYTTQMIAGLIEKSSGDAVKLSATYLAFNQQLNITLSDAQYYTEPHLPNTNEADLDVGYAFAGRWKGLTLRNRFGILTGNRLTGRELNERVMVQYSL